MKNLFLALTLVFASNMVAITADAKQGGVFLAGSTHFNFDAKLELDYVHDVFVQLDLNKKQIVLTLNHNRPCPPNQMCPMMYMMPTVIELPLVSVKRNSCNSLVYTAKQDRRMVDGILQKIVLTNNKTMTCKTLVAVPATEVQYTTSGYDRFNARMVETESVIYATALRMMANILPATL